jgi:hypothetical protein
MPSFRHFRSTRFQRGPFTPHSLHTRSRLGVLGDEIRHVGRPAEVHGRDRCSAISRPACARRWRCSRTSRTTFQGDAAAVTYARSHLRPSDQPGESLPRARCDVCARHADRRARPSRFLTWLADHPASKEEICAVSKSRSPGRRHADAVCRDGARRRAAACVSSDCDGPRAPCPRSPWYLRAVLRLG